MARRWLPWFVLCAGCGDGSAAIDGAFAAIDGAPEAIDAAFEPTDGPPADAPATEAPPPQLLDTVMLRPASERSLQHLECAGNASSGGVAIWRETDGDGKHGVWASHVANDQWQPAASLGGRPTADLNRTGVTVDSEGRALAVWNESDGPAAGVVGTRFLPDTGWAAPARIGAGWVLTMVGDAAGDAVAFGVLEGSPPTLLRYSPAVGWMEEANLKVPQPGFFFASPTGRGVMFWNQADAGWAALMASEYVGGVWSPAMTVQDARPFDHPLPSVNAALAADGSGLVVWNRGGELQGELWASGRTQFDLWQVPHQLSSGDAPLWTTTVLAQEEGGALVTWETGMPPGRKIWAATRRTNLWGETVNLGEGSEMVTGALAASGEALVVWSTPSRVYSRRYRPARGWSLARLASGNNGGVADLCAFIDDRGRGWAVWISGGPQVLRAALITN
jgi:hypothetical protein